MLSHKKPRRLNEQAPRYRLGREAKALVEPFAAQLGIWQMRIAYLRGVQDQAGRLSPEERAALAAEALNLVADIDDATKAFSEMMKIREADLRAHGVIEDTSKALHNVQSAADNISRSMQV